MFTQSSAKRVAIYKSQIRCAHVILVQIRTKNSNSRRALGENFVRLGKNYLPLKGFLVLSCLLLSLTVIALGDSGVYAHKYFAHSLVKRPTLVQENLHCNKHDTTKRLQADGGNNGNVPLHIRQIMGLETRVGDVDTSR